jgi:hypothetical protein
VSQVPPRNVELVRQFENHLSIITGFCELLLAGCSETERRHQDLLEIQKAAHAALALVPELANRLG